MNKTKTLTNSMFRRYASLLLLIALLPLSVGCGRVVFRPNGQAAVAQGNLGQGQAAQPIALSPTQQQQLAQLQQQLQTRAASLDTDNQELESLLAQARQESQLISDQLAATQDQLRATADQLAMVEKDRTGLQNKTKALTASIAQQIGQSASSMQANNTLLKPLTVANIPGVDVRQDGDVIRITLPTDQLFQPGSALVRPGSEQTLRSIAANLLQSYPEQRIGIEGHTDGAPVASTQYPTSHHLSVAQATAIYESLRRSLNVPAEQLFVIGHGANHPIVSNGTEAGRQRNRRVELVVYPEMAIRR